MEYPTMTQPSESPQPAIGKRWGLWWTLGNSLAWGITLGLPLVIADLVAEATPFVQRYDSYVAPALLFWMLGLGLFQWAMLRKPLAISAWWIGSFILPLLLLLIPAVAMFSLLGEGFLLLLLGSYPLLLSLNQWWLLRRRVRPVWGWGLVSWIAIAMAVPTGFICALILHGSISQAEGGILTCAGGGIGGLIYGFITRLGLGKLIGEKRIQPAAIVKKPGLDVAPGDKPWQRLIVSNLLFLVTLIGWGLCLPKPDFTSSGESPFSNPLAISLLGAFLIFYSYISILFHELGHLIFALCNGFDVRAIAVDRFMFIRSGPSLKLKRIKYRFAGGFVFPVLKNTRNLRKKLFFMYLGGPAASLFLFAIGTIPLFISNSLSKNAGLWFITLFSAYNLFIFIYNSLPLQLGYLKTDGRRILDLVQMNPHGKRAECFYRFNTALRQGIRPKDIEPEVIEGSLAIPETSSDHISGLMVAYEVALDQAQFALAGDYLDQALGMSAYYPQLFRDALLLEGAYFEAQIRQRPDQAQQWFEQIQETALIEPHSLLRAEAALSLAQGDRNTALVKAEQGLAMAQKDVFMRGQATAEREWLQEILQAAAEAPR
jgi:hypothetical protein